MIDETHLRAGKYIGYQLLVPLDGLPGPRAQCRTEEAKIVTCWQDLP